MMVLVHPNMLAWQRCGARWGQQESWEGLDVLLVSGRGWQCLDARTGTLQHAGVATLWCTPGQQGGREGLTRTHALPTPSFLFEAWVVEMLESVILWLACLSAWLL